MSLETYTTEQLLSEIQARTTPPPAPEPDPNTEVYRAALEEVQATAAAALQGPDPAPAPTPPPAPTPAPAPARGKEFWLFLPQGKKDLNEVWLPATQVLPDRLITFWKVGASSDWGYDLDPPRPQNPNTHPFPSEIVRRSGYFSGQAPTYGMRFEPQDLLEDLAAGKHAAYTAKFFEQAADVLPTDGPLLDLCPGHEPNGTWGTPLTTQAERDALRAMSPDDRLLPYAVRRSPDDPWQPDPRDVQYFADWIGSLSGHIARTGAPVSLTFNPNISMNPDGTPSQIDYEPLYVATRGAWSAVGLDGYNGPWLAPTHLPLIEVFRRDLEKMHGPVYDGLPVGIYETATRPGYPGGWWTEGVRDLNREFPKVDVLTQFELEKPGDGDWRVLDSPAEIVDLRVAMAEWRATLPA